MPDESVISGLTVQAEQQLRMVVREEMRAVVDALYDDPRCPRDCARVNTLNRVVFGATEDGEGHEGLDTRVGELERAMTRITRVTWLAVSALIVGMIGLGITLLQVAILGR